MEQVEDHTVSSKSRLHNQYLLSNKLMKHHRRQTRNAKTYERSCIPFFTGLSTYATHKTFILYYTILYDHLIPILSNDQFIFKAQLTSLYMHHTNYNFKLNDRNKSPKQYWLQNGIKLFSLQFNFLRPSIYYLKTGENDSLFLHYHKELRIT